MLSLLLVVTGLIGFFALSEYGWVGGLFFTVFLGFAQDLIRKLSDSQSTYFGGLALGSFIISFLILRSRCNSWSFSNIFWFNRDLMGILTIFIYLLVLQSFNSLARFGELATTIVGLLFYLLPLIALWVGYNIGIEVRIVRKIIFFYLLVCSVWGTSVLLNIMGVESALFKEVGTGLDITGLEIKFNGFWRTSEIAAWHLAAGSCFAFILAMTEERSLRQVGYIIWSVGFAFLTSSTGRRKGLALILMFVATFLIYYTFTSKTNKVYRALITIFLVIMLGLGFYDVVFNSKSQSLLGDIFEERVSRINADETQERISVQGIQAFLRGIEIGGPFGLGTGAGTNTGNTGIGQSRSTIRSLAFVSEGGGGRIISELGWLGFGVIILLVWNMVLLYIRNFKLGITFMNNNDFNFLFGLVVFTFVNAINFFSAGQTYNDPFILIVLGLCFGSFLAIPLVVSRFYSGK